MYDLHMHSTVSFDGQSKAADMAAAAAAAGLKEICFTDHIDYCRNDPANTMVFSTEAYNAAYDGLELPGLTIRKGLEFGLLDWNKDLFKKDLARRHFDFVLGSIHFVDDLDVYLEEYWDGKTVEEAERRYLETTLEMVRLHDDFDVLAHLTYLTKARAHPARRLIEYSSYRELIDAILQTLVRKGKGLEMNTSGVDRAGGFLPTADYFRRFKELGGEIVTVGSDAHDCSRVGQYCGDACAVLAGIFGYVCTFEDRRPVFHKL